MAKGQQKSSKEAKKPKKDTSTPKPASGLTDPELSMAATAHFFAFAGLDLPAAVNGPQYLADRGTVDPAFRPRGDVMQVPTGPGLGIELPKAARASMTTVAEEREALPA